MPYDQKKLDCFLYLLYFFGAIFWDRRPMVTMADKKNTTSYRTTPSPKSPTNEPTVRIITDQQPLGSAVLFHRTPSNCPPSTLPPSKRSSICYTYDAVTVAHVAIQLSHRFYDTDTTDESSVLTSKKISRWEIGISSGKTFVIHDVKALQYPCITNVPSLNTKEILWLQTSKKFLEKDHCSYDIAWLKFTVPALLPVATLPPSISTSNKKMNMSILEGSCFKGFPGADQNRILRFVCSDLGSASLLRHCGISLKAAMKNFTSHQCPDDPDFNRTDFAAWGTPVRSCIPYTYHIGFSLRQRSYCFDLVIPVVGSVERAPGMSGGGMYSKNNQFLGVIVGGDDVHFLVVSIGRICASFVKLCFPNTFHKR